MENDTIGVVLQEVLDQMLEGFQVIGSDWRYVYVNQTVAEHGKRTKSELIGKTMMECYPGIEHTAMFAECQKAMEEKTDATIDNEFTYPDGSMGWFKLFIHPIQDGILILSVDITEQKKLEQQLHEKIREVDILMNSTVDRESRMSELRDEITSLKTLSDTIS